MMKIRLLLCVFAILLLQLILMPVYKVLNYTHCSNPCSTNTQRNSEEKFKSQKSTPTFSDMAPDGLKYSEHNENELIKDKIFWSDFSESFLPKGLPFAESMKLVENIRNQSVKSLRLASQKMCGDGLNGIAVLEDGTTMCVRYKDDQKLIYAEVLAFYLSRMLQMDNVPEAVLSRTESAPWKEVNISALSWRQNRIVVMMRRIENVTSRPYEPQIIKSAYRERRVITGDILQSYKVWNSTELADLIQWGTLIVFDNLIGNFDRLFEWRKKDIGSYVGKLHNSVKTSEGKIWLFDQETSFFYQYRNRTLIANYVTLYDFLDKLLQTTCVFQTSVVNELKILFEQTSPFQTFWNFARSHEPLIDTMKKDDIFRTGANFFNKRLAHIIQWVKICYELQINRT